MDALRDHPGLAAVNRIGLRSSLSCAKLALWDERAGRLVTFSEAESDEALEQGSEKVV